MNETTYTESTEDSEGSMSRTLSEQIDLYKSTLERAKAKFIKLCGEVNRELSNDEIQEFNIDRIKNTAAANSEQSKRAENAFDLESESAINENIQRGLQRLSLKLLNDKNKITPLNELITSDIQNSEKINIVYEYAKSRIIKLLMQVKLINFKQNTASLFLILFKKNKTLTNLF